MRPKILLLLVCSLFLFTQACAPLAPGGAYKGDKILYTADKTITSSYATLHAFVKWEYENRQSLDKWPEIREAADHVRRNAERWITSAITLRDVYEANPGPESKVGLETALRVLNQAITEAIKYLSLNTQLPPPQ